MSIPLILRLSESGYPIEWATWKDAVQFEAKNHILWEYGTEIMIARGGYQMNGVRSEIKVNSIIATRGHFPVAKDTSHPPSLTREGVYRRDGNLCMYCGKRFPSKELDLEHVIPISQGGGLSWTNIVTSCKPCNNKKDAQTPEQAGMPLIAVPYVPNKAEFLILSNRRILSDQMEFLMAQVGKNSRLRLTN